MPTVFFIANRLIGEKTLIGLHVNTVKCKMEKCGFRNFSERLLIFYYKGWEEKMNQKKED